MKRSTDLYDLLDLRWDELDHLAKPQLTQKTTHISKKMRRVGGRANRVVMALLDIHNKAWGI